MTGRSLGCPKHEHSRHPDPDHGGHRRRPSPTFDGKALLIVNVASRCGLAPQYETLEKLQQQYGERGLQVLGFPSNQFLQELRIE